MTPGTLNLLCPAGSTFTRTLTWSIGGTPVNLTGYTARLQVRERAAASAKLLDLTTANGGISLGGVAGTITITATATQTAAMPSGTWRYDLELVSGGGVVTRLVEGAFTVSPEVTR